MAVNGNSLLFAERSWYLGVVKDKKMVVLHRSLKDLLRIELNVEALMRLEWRDFGNGLFMSRLAREGKRELVLYRAETNASPDAFSKHEHIGGEFYFVLKGGISDETGAYQEGDVVFLDPQSEHTPRTIGETVVLVLWPQGVRIVDRTKNHDQSNAEEKL